MIIVSNESPKAERGKAEKVHLALITLTNPACLKDALAVFFPHETGANTSGLGR
jgi:hypothetical protein